MLDLEATCSSKKSNNGVKVVHHDLCQIGNASATGMNPCGGRTTIDESVQGPHTIRQDRVHRGHGVEAIGDRWLVPAAVT
jgi:UDP-3-O-[3-hydroxymyristoyl] glucosamine N-acyltransferase